jgi:hypothetical protein
MRTATSKQFRQLILGKYPALQGSEPYRRFFCYLCFSGFFDAETHQLVIPTKTIAEEFYQQSYNVHFNGLAKLQQFQSDVLPNLKWTDHKAFSPNSFAGKARMITDLGIDPATLAALHDECLKPCKDQIDFVTGEPRGRKTLYQERAAETEKYRQELAQFQVKPTARKILDYLAKVKSGHLFLRKIHENETAIKSAIALLELPVQEIQYRILRSVELDPNIYYYPSAEARTCRLSPRGDTLVGLRKEVRKAATSGWVECDLRSSQFAILASKLKAPTSLAFIATGKSLWRELYGFLTGVDGAPPEPIKKVLKEAIYSVCYGRSKTELHKLLKPHGLERMLDHPILKELLALRKVWFDEIEKAGGAFDVWGEFQAVDNTKDLKSKKSRRWAGAVGASVIQSIEMEIIAPIFDVAKAHGRSDQFSICLFQHDGATMSFVGSEEKKARAMRKLKKAVEDRAKALDVETVLEFTDL